MKFFSRNKHAPVVQRNQSAKDLTIDDFLAEYIRPFLKLTGFAKYGRTFYRTRGDIFDIINFQGNKSNGFGNQKFYINCGMGSFAFQKDITGQEKPKPKDYRDLYHERINTITGYEPDFTLQDNHQTVDTSSFGAEVVEQLQKLLGFFASANSVGDLIDLCIERAGLQDHEELCYYLAKHSDRERLERYIRSLHDRMANGRLKAQEDELDKRLDKISTRMSPRQSGDRWPMFADRMYAVIGEYQKDAAIAQLLEEHAPTNHPETRFKPPVGL